jgi:hypothetical protein
MRGTEIVKAVREQKRSDQQFIRLWRKEEDFLDYDLIERFMDNAGSDQEFGGFDLLTMDEMLPQVEKVCGKRFAITQKSGEKLIEWERKSGGQRVCPYTPRTVIDILDSETRGTIVD